MNSVFINSDHESEIPQSYPHVMIIQSANGHNISCIKINNAACIVSIYCSIVNFYTANAMTILQSYNHMTYGLFT